jgi:hypothetical protein
MEFEVRCAYVDKCRACNVEVICERQQVLINLSFAAGTNMTRGRVMITVTQLSIVVSAILGLVVIALLL